MKLLAPAGNLQTLKTAVYNGADEVYIGINQFNARNNIDGFTLESAKEAVDFAHLFGVKVLLAVNILFNDDEIKDALNLIVKAYNFGMDAFIVQDIGLINLLYINYPEIPVHASTQMGIHNLEGVKAVEKLGVKRVVLSRETPILEIKRIKENSNVEIEYFVHGALCVSFSGNCYLSSYRHGASGNRGKCKQLCRLPYTLLKDGKPVKKGYLLSAKDFSLIDRLDELENAGVDVLKIEGRARREAYVGLVVREYKKALTGCDFNKENLLLAFNRGFTNGYFDGNGKIISLYQNHIGVSVGKVLDVRIGKRFNVVEFSSYKMISPKSTLKFFDGETEVCTATAYDLTKISDNKYSFTTTQSVKRGLSVRLILDDNLEKEVLSYKRKTELNIMIEAKEGEKIVATCDDIIVYGDVLDSAKSKPLSVSEIKENFSKNEYFEPFIIANISGQPFISKGKLNEFRRNFYSKIIDHIQEKFYKNLAVKDVGNPKFTNNLNNFHITETPDFTIAENIVVYSPEKYDITDIKRFVLTCKNQAKKPYLDLPNFALEKDINYLSDIVSKTGIGVVANNLYAINFNTDIIIGAGLNVYNGFSAEFFNKPFMTAESDIAKRIDFPLMTLKHCPIKSHVGGNCDNCKYQDGYIYVQDDGKTMKLKRKKITECTFYLV